MSGATHQVVADCAYAACGAAAVAVSTVTPETLSHFTLWGGGVLIGYRLFQAFVMEPLGVRWPTKPFWTWRRGDGNGRD